MNYFNIDAMDPCQEMLNVARNKKYYRNYFCQFATGDINDPLCGTFINK